MIPDNPPNSSKDGPIPGAAPASAPGLGSDTSSVGNSVINN